MTCTSVYTFLHLHTSVYISTYLSLILSLSLSFNAVGAGWVLRRGKNQHPKQHGHLWRGIVRLLCCHCRLNMFIICIHVCMYIDLHMSSAPVEVTYYSPYSCITCFTYVLLTWLMNFLLYYSDPSRVLCIQCSMHTPCFSHVLLYLLIYYKLCFIYSFTTNFTVHACADFTLQVLLSMLQGGVES